MKNHLFRPEIIVVIFLLRAGLFIRRFCLVFDKLSFNQVVQLYQRFRAMYSEVKVSRSVDADAAAGSIVNETRDLSLDDLMDQSVMAQSHKSGSVGIFI